MIYLNTQGTESFFNRINIYCFSTCPYGDYLFSSPFKFDFIF